MKHEEENRSENEIPSKEETKKTIYNLQDGINLNYKVIDNLIKSSKLLEEFKDKNSK